MATSIEKSKKLNVVNKPLHPPTNPAILVKIKPPETKNYFAE